jgi:hypothetical protein
MAVSSAGLRPKSDCSGKAQKQLYSNLQTRPLVREGATNLQTRKCLKEISRRKINWSQVPDGRLTLGQTGRLAVGRKLAHSLTHYAIKTYGGADAQIHVFLTLALVGSEWSVSRPCNFTQGERAPGTHWIRGWVGPRAGVNDTEKRNFFTLTGLELQPLHCPARS